jgi:hypothetical protein
VTLSRLKRHLPLQAPFQGLKTLIMRGEWLFVLVAGLAVGGLGAGFALLSRKARLSRRRHKSHSRLVSTSKRPSVRFSVKPPKED